MPPTHRRTFALRRAGPTLIRGEGFAHLFRGFLSISPRSQKTSVFWGVPIVDNIPADIDADDAGDAGDAGDVVPEVGPTLPKTCSLKILKS